VATRFSLVLLLLLLLRPLLLLLWATHDVVSGPDKNIYTDAANEHDFDTTGSFDSLCAHARGQ
jgi:hypothetical protein